MFDLDPALARIFRLASTLAINSGAAPWERVLYEEKKPEGEGGGGGAPPGPAKPFATFEDAEAFNKRMAREAKKILKDAGVEDEPAAVKAKLDRLATMEAAAAEAERAKLSEIERAKLAETEAKAKEAVAMGQAEEARLDAHLYRVFAEERIGNFDYARFAVLQKLQALPEGETLDERAFLAELAKDPAQRQALGMAPVVEPAPGKPPPTTTPRLGAPPAPPPPPGSPPTPPPDVMKMSAAEFADYKRRQHGAG